jgi:hypothetical protein
MTKMLFEFDAFIKSAKKNSKPQQEKVYAIGNTLEEALAEISDFTEEAVFTGNVTQLSKDWQIDDKKCK